MTGIAHCDRVFEDELCPIPTRDRTGCPIIMDKDEHPREDTTMEQLSRLKPVFKSNGVVTAGNASVSHKNVNLSSALISILHVLS